MRLRIGTSFILVLGLLAGSTVGVAAQSALVSQMDDEEWVWDDSRLNGDYEEVGGDVIASGQGDGLAQGLIHITEFRVSNDEGSWAGEWAAAFFEPTSSEIPAEFRPVLTDNVLLIGEGGYEGLVAYLTEGPEERLWGVILEREMVE